MRSPAGLSVRDCAPSPINSGRVEIVTPDCRTNYPCRSSVASDRLSGAALVSQRKPDHGPTNNESAPHGCPVRGASVSMLLLGLVRVGRLLAVLPFAEHARGDRERGVDERDLDLPVTVGSPA